MKPATPPAEIEAEIEYLVALVGLLESMQAELDALRAFPQRCSKGGG
jgi:hypothetical protein